ncbi:MAG: TetR/AcrR family transcriptional regulator [Alphaproteobacteria bacterium]
MRPRNPGSLFAKPTTPLFIAKWRWIGLGGGVHPPGNQTSKNRWARLTSVFEFYLMVVRKMSNSNTQIKAETVAKPLKKSDRTREQILHAAAKLFREQGFAATTLRQIAVRAKLKAGSIYYYFSSKNEILDEVLELGIRVVFDSVRQAHDALPEEASGRQRIEAAIEAHLYALLKYSDFTSANFRIYGQVSKAARMRNRNIRRAYTDYWKALLAGVRDAGEIAGDVDLTLTRLFLLGSINGAIEWYDDKKEPIPVLANRLCATLFDGVGR